MSREILVWGVLLITCILSAIIGGMVVNSLIVLSWFLFSGVLNFLILFHGSKRCSAIGVNNHCYTILFLTVCIFAGIFTLTVLVCGCLTCYWFFVNDLALISHPLYGWFMGIAVNTICTFMSALIIMLWKDTKMCPGWSSEDSNDHNIDYDETDCEFADAEEIEDLPAKWAGRFFYFLEK